MAFVSDRNTFAKILLQLQFPQNAGRMWTISPNLKENKLIGQSLAGIRQRETPAICFMQIRYPCFAFSFHSQHIRKIRNGICKHS